jgi:hypothetical protein
LSGWGELSASSSPGFFVAFRMTKNGVGDKPPLTNVEHLYYYVAIKIKIHMLITLFTP